MPTTFEIAVEPLSAAAFAPFGQLISEQDAAPLFSVPGAKTWGVDFEIDGTPEVHYARFDHKDDMTFAMIERHFNVTQAFVPLGGAANVNVLRRADRRRRSGRHPTARGPAGVLFRRCAGRHDVEGHLAFRPLSGAAAERRRRSYHGRRDDGGVSCDDGCWALRRKTDAGRRLRQAIRSGLSYHRSQGADRGLGHDDLGLAQGGEAVEVVALFTHHL